MVMGVGVKHPSKRRLFDKNEPRALLLPLSGSEPAMPRARLISGLIDWDIIKKWVEHCDRNHFAGCKPEQKLAVVGLQFIDCETLQVICSPETPPPYITLSYLWNRAGEFKDRPLLDGIPLIIEDAIQATRELGFRYLWVDRYCNPQGVEETNTLIANMNQFDRSGALNIIANGERGASYGLPGVSAVSRIPQATFKIGSKDHVL